MAAPRSSAEGQAAPTEFQGFRGACAYAGTAEADPIAKTHHLHDFFGAKGVTSDTTYDGLRAAATTCLRADDKSGYWAPALKIVHADGTSEIRTPDWSGFYFQTRSGLDPANTKAFPKGFRMIATEEEPNHGRIDWHCNVIQTGRAITQGPPASCTRSDDGIGLRITFPECWDGQARDPGTGAHDVTGAVRAPGGRLVCPRSHPVQLPTLKVWPDYPGFQLEEGDRIEVSMGHEQWGGPASMHADFFMGYGIEVMRTLVLKCIREPASSGARRPDYCDAGTIPGRS